MMQIKNATHVKNAWMMTGIDSFEEISSKVKAQS